MKKLLLLVFTATLVLFFTPNMFAQMGKTVKVANNNELIRALNNPNVDYVEITQDGFYDAVMMDAKNGTVITKQKIGASRSTCTFAITRTNKCFVSPTDVNTAVASSSGTGCPPTPSSGNLGWSSPESGTTLHFTMASQYDLTATFTTDQAGLYHLTYKWDNFGNEASANVYLYSSGEITQLEASPDTVCGDSTQITFDYDMGLQPTDTIVTWYVNGTPDATLPTEPGSFYFNPGACGAYQLVLSVTNTQNCGEDRDTLNLFFYDTPVVDAGEDDTVCGLTYTGLAGGYSGGSCYVDPLVQTWSLDNSFANAGTATFYGSSPIWDSVVVSACGAYQFVYTVENGLCDGSDTMAVYFYDTPVVLAGDDQEVCGMSATLNGTFTASCTGGNTPVGTWSGAGLTFDGDTATATQCGTFQAIYTVENGTCSASDTVELKFYDTPVVNAGTDQDVCGLSATLAPGYEAGCTNGDTAVTAWSGAGLTFDGDTATATACGTYEAVYTVTLGPCSSSDTVVLKFYDTPAVNAGADQDVCGLEATLDHMDPATTVSCSNGGTPTGAWSGAGLTFDGDTATAAQCGTYEAVYTVTNGPCSNSDTVVLKFYQAPEANAGEDMSICGEKANLYGTYDGGCANGGDTTETWTSNDPAVTIYGTDSVTVSQCGTYELYYTVSVGNGVCSDVDTVTYEFLDHPAVEAGNDEDNCGVFVSPGVFVANGTLKGNFTATCTSSSPTINWSLFDGPSGSNVEYIDGNDVDTTRIKVHACGIYKFLLTVDNGGCIGADTVTFKFYDMPAISAGNDTAVCGYNTPITLNPSWSVVCDNGDPVTTGWVPMSTNPGTATFDGDTVTVDVCGTYGFIYVVTNTTCTALDTLMVEFYDTPDVTAHTTDTVEVCGLSVDLMPTVTVNCTNSGTVDSVWSGAGLTFNGNTASALYCGTYTAYLTITNGPCSNMDSVVIKFYDTPDVTANINGDTVEVCGNGTMLYPEVMVPCANGSSVDSVWSGTGLTFMGDSAYAATCGTYTAYLDITVGPCTNRDSVVLKFYDTPVVDAGAGDTLCATGATLAGTHTEACTNGGTVDVLWTKVSGPGTVVFTDATVDGPDVAVGQCGEYVFKYEVTNGPCSAFDTVSYFFTDTPMLTVTVPEDSVCGFDTQLNATYNVSCALNDTGVLTEATGVATIVFTAPDIYDISVPTCGTYDFTYTVTNGPCSHDTTFQISFFESPQPEVGGDTVVFTCSTTTYTVTDPGCSDPSSIEYSWNVTGGAFASGVTTATGAAVDVVWDSHLGMGSLTVHAEIASLPGCSGDTTIEIMKQYPTLEGQVKYWNGSETYMPTPFSTDDYSTIPFDYFYVTLYVNGTTSADSVATAYVQPRLMEDLGELMSYFDFELNTEDNELGCDAKYYLKVWDGGFVYHNNPPAPAENTTLGNNYTYNNWGGVNATDALAIQLMATNVQVNAAPYNYTWVGTNSWSPSYGYYSQGIADVNHTFGNGGNIVTGITALDALTAKYRAVGLLGSYPDNSDANTNQFRPNFMVTGRMVSMLPEITFPTPFDSTHVDDVPFTHSGNEYMYFQPAVNHKYTSDTLPWGGKNNYINLYYEAVGDINASYTPPGSGLKSKSAMTLDYEGLASAAKGSVMTIPVSVEKDIDAVGAITLSLNYRNDLIEVLGTNFSDDDVFINQEEGILNIAWFSTDAVEFNADATIAQIRVRVLADIPVGTELFELNDISELADANAQPIADVNLKTIGVTTDKGIINASELTTSNYPNPFDDQTTISYTLPENGKVKVEVYNSVGMLVKVLVDEYQESGVNNVNFSSSNIRPGVYVYHITVQGETNNYTAVRRMIVVH